MVEYKKKKLILQSGGTRNYYYKVSSDGKKKQVSKNEYLEKKGGSDVNDQDAQNDLLIAQLQKTLNALNGNNLSSDYMSILQNQINKIKHNKIKRAQLKEKANQEKIILNGIHFGTLEANRFLSRYSWSRNNKFPHLKETKERLLQEKKDFAPQFFKDLATKVRDYITKKGTGVKGPLFNSIKKDLMQILNGQVEMYKYWDNLEAFRNANAVTMTNTKERKIAYMDKHISVNFQNTNNKFTWEDSFTRSFIHDVRQNLQN